MPATSSDGSSRDERGPVAAAISTAVVHVFSEHTGRGPTRARTTIDGTTVLVLLHDGMTKAERSLVDAGKHAEVLQLRRSFPGADGRQSGRGGRKRLTASRPA